jgi:hypothetical protein
MNYRPLLIFAAIAAVICIVAFWYVQTTPPPPPLPTITVAPPERTSPPPTGVREERPAPRTEKAVVDRAPLATPAPELAPWEIKIDQALTANPDNSEAANTATAQTLISLLPTFPPEGQAQAAQHISDLITDKDYAKVMPLLRNPALSEEALDTLFTDLMNRDDATKLPAMLEVAKIPNHPNREEALTDLGIFLDAEHGNDWPKWDAALKEYLRKAALEEAEANAATK